MSSARINFISRPYQALSKVLASPSSIILLAIFLQNVPFYFLSGLAFINRPAINLDYVIIFVAPAGVVGRLALYVVLLAIDCSVTFSYYFHFTPREFVASAKFLDLLSVDVDESQILAIAVLVCAAALGAQWFCAKRLRRHTALAVLAYMGLFGLDVMNGTSSLLPGEVTRIVGRNIAGSRLGALVLSTRRAGYLPMVGLSDAASAIALADKEIDNAVRAGRPILLMISESLGEPLEARLDTMLFGQLTADAWVSDRFLVRRETIPFSGSTTWGELRELCASKADYKNLDAAQLGRCLPFGLKHWGYETIGYHGFSSRMFDREAWWPRVGIEQSYFAEDLEHSLSRRCGSIFRGMCDEDMLETIGAGLRGRRFAYFLTLNAHFPIEVRESASAEYCDPNEFGKNLCAYVGVYERLFAELKRMLSILPTLPLVVIVGDHAPAGSGPGRKAAPFATNVVPVLILSPK